MTDDRNIVASLRRALGAELAARRMERQLTQACLAKRLDVHRTTISHLEAGDHGAPLTFWKLADDVLVASGALVDAYERVETAMAAHQRHKADAVVDRYRCAAAQHWSEGRIVTDASHSLSDLATLLDNAISESVELTAATEATSLGAVGMDQLQADVKSLASAHLRTSAYWTATATILARRRVFRFLNSTHRPLQKIQPITLLRKRQFGEAATVLRPVLSIALEHRNAGLRQQLRRVRRELTALRYQSAFGYKVIDEIDKFLAAQISATGRSAAVGLGAP